jgi:hypothetical protein
MTSSSWKKTVRPRRFVDAESKLSVKFKGVISDFI